MACTITIPFWPENGDCLSWSADCQIAVTGGEQIAILTPKLKGREANGSLWDTTLIKVNAFTSKELPLRDPPLSNACFSIGEDLSQRQALEAKWSPPGLARHQGCALAVLSANHVLSIWAPEGRPNVAKSWRRHIIVNHAVDDYYASVASGPQGRQGEQRQTENREICQRIRSFAWSPRLTPSWQEPLERYFYLAVSTEGGDILFLRLISPYCRSSTRARNWTAAVVGSLNLELQTRALIPDIEGHRFASSLCWDKWDWRDPCHVSQLAYIYHGKLFTTSAQTKNDQIQSDVSRVHIRDRNDVSGPLRFVPGERPIHSLIAFGEDAVFQVDISAEGDTYLSHHLDDRWEDITGVAFTFPGKERVDIHITSLLSMSGKSTATLRLPLERDAVGTQPAWQQAIVASKAAYGRSLDVDDQVLERTSGIANSPIGECIATCSTMHPADCIEYVIGADQKSVLSITVENELRDDTQVIPDQQYCSMEAVLYSLTHLAQRWSEREADPEWDREQQILSLAESISLAKQIDGEFEDAHDSSLAGLYRRLVRLLEEGVTFQRARAQRIIDLAFKRDQQRPGCIREIVSALVREVLSQPLDGSVDDLSDRIRSLYMIIGAKLESADQCGTDADASGCLEKCRICQQPIRFESMRWARCSTGHQFARCALSFLAIDDPGTTSKCGICGLQYLNSSVLAKSPTVLRDRDNADGSGSGQSRDTCVDTPPNASPQRAGSLAQILFAACEYCIYCGGKFID